MNKIRLSPWIDLDINGCSIRSPIGDATVLYMNEICPLIKIIVYGHPSIHIEYCAEIVVKSRNKAVHIWSTYHATKQAAMNQADDDIQILAKDIEFLDQDKYNSLSILK